VRLIARNQVLLIARHYPPELIVRWLWPILVAQALWGAVAMRHHAGFAWLRGKWQGLCEFSTARAFYHRIDLVLLERLVRENEHVIWETQQWTSFDFYWRVYFLLTGEAK
jgi:hypothetical protein